MGDGHHPPGCPTNYNCCLPRHSSGESLHCKPKRPAFRQTEILECHVSDRSRRESKERRASQWPVGQGVCRRVRRQRTQPFANHNAVTSVWMTQPRLTDTLQGRYRCCRYRELSMLLHVFLLEAKFFRSMKHEHLHADIRRNFTAGHS